MKLFVCFLSRDRKLLDYFGSRKDTIIPKDSLNRGFYAGRSVKILQFAVDGANVGSSSDFERLLVLKIKEADAFMLVIDEEFAAYTKNLENCLFVVQYKKEDVDFNLQNFFHKLLAKSLKSFGQILSKFLDANSIDLLTLPLRNFKSAELNEISILCRSLHNSPDFGNLIDCQLVSLKKRIRPRRRSSYTKRYVVDDNRRFFEFGNEKHARFATGEPHLPSCHIAGHFRFGKKIDEQRHFNVSEGEGDNTLISGNFVDCHNSEHSVQNRTHLNIFSNDYF